MRTHALELERAGDDVEAVQRVLEAARDELDAIVRRPIADVHAQTFVELSAEIVDRGQGWPVGDVSIALRCTPTMVRRVRVTAGRDAEYGRQLDVERVNGAPAAFAVQLLEAGYSGRAAALIVGVPRSTLHDRVRRAG